MDRKNFFLILKDIRSLILLSLFIALYAVFSLFAIYITDQLRINFTFMPVAWASALFGPIAGGIVGAFGDIAGWIVRPTYAYFPGLTISGFISGIIYGIFLYKKEMTMARIFYASVTMILIVELGLNTLWIMILYGSAFKAIIAGRLLKALLMLPIQMIVLQSTAYILKKYRRTEWKKVQ